MKRNYDSGVKNDVIFFTGVEIEYTPAYGKKTLFVTGVHPINTIVEIAKKEDCDHIYLGANHSFVSDQQAEYESLALDLLKLDFWITLDFDICYYDAILDTLCCLNKHDRFITQISVKLPYLDNLNYNTCIKIDDQDFRSTNPGVWVHQLYDLMDRNVFTDWSQYGKDKIVK